MLVSLSMLKNYVSIDCELKDFIHLMTMAGIQVESVTVMHEELQNIVTGQIVQIEKHPNADQLLVCKIDVKEEKLLQICTAATNVFEGAIVPVAKHHSRIHGNIKISKTKMRGLESEGMLCSLEELGLENSDFPSSDPDGILILPKHIAIGIDIRNALDLHDVVFDFEITSNRPDLNSVIGIAREISALLQTTFTYPPIDFTENEDTIPIINQLEVEIKNTHSCKRYCAKKVDSIQLGESPAWMRKHLKNSGIRPINNIVDISNYVMLEFGQPMHAFDFSLIDKKITIQNNEKRNEFTTLDGVLRMIDSDTLMIADQSKNIAIAGIMGGENSKVSEHANSILFESANFEKTGIRISSKKLGLRTDASSRYEKGIDPELSIICLKRAMHLVEQLNCGVITKGTIDVYPKPFTPYSVSYHPKHINAVLSTKISEERMADFLEELEIKVDRDKFLAYPPSFRNDIQEEADLAEEIARRFGYENIQVEDSKLTFSPGKKTWKQQVTDQIKQQLAMLGFYEAYFYSFDNVKSYQKLLIEPNFSKMIEIENPLGEDFKYMRTSTVDGMLKALALNFNRSNKNVQLFEIGKTYEAKQLPLTEHAIEKTVLTLGLYGEAVDFYHLKSYIEVILDTIGIENIAYEKLTSLPYMHPGRSAQIMIQGKNFGYMGEVHPTSLHHYGIVPASYIAVMDLDLLLQLSIQKKTFTPLNRFPSIQRDIALIVDEHIIHRDILSSIQKAGGKYLESVELFDVYTGQHIESGKKSMAYSLFFRAKDRTLVDEEINKILLKILAELEIEYRITLRE